MARPAETYRGAIRNRLFGRNPVGNRNPFSRVHATPFSTWQPRVALDRHKHETRNRLVHSTFRHQFKG